MTDRMINEIEELNLMIDALPKKWPVRKTKNTEMINDVIDRTAKLKDTYTGVYPKGTIDNMLLECLILTVETKLFDRDYAKFKRDFTKLEKKYAT